MTCIDCGKPIVNCNKFIRCLRCSGRHRAVTSKPKVHTCMGDYITSVEQAVAIVEQCTPLPPRERQHEELPIEVAMSIARRFDVDWCDVLDRTRETSVVLCREAIVVELRESGLSYPEIARTLGRSNHSTVHFAHKRALKRAKELV